MLRNPDISKEEQNSKPIQSSETSRQFASVLSLRSRGQSAREIKFKRTVWI